MPVPTTPALHENIFLRMHPFVRLLLGLLLTSIAWIFVSGSKLTPLVKVITMWDVFAFSMVVTGWIILLTRTTGRIRELAKKDDGSLVFVFSVILISSLASMIAV